VVVPRVGGLPEDLRLEELLVDPARVEVRGPETELKAMPSIETYPLDLSQVTENIQRELDIRLPGNLSEVTPTRVTVKIRVTHQKSEERISGVPVEVRSVGAEGFIVDPSMVDIRLIGIRDALKALERAQVIPYVRVGQVGEQRQKLRVEVEVPKGITVLAVEPAEVDVVRSAKMGARLPLPKATARSGK